MKDLSYPIIELLKCLISSLIHHQLEEDWNLL